MFFPAQSNVLISVVPKYYDVSHEM